jgi:hypothetical protein
VNGPDPADHVDLAVAAFVEALLTPEPDPPADGDDPEDGG